MATETLDQRVSELEEALQQAIRDEQFSSARQMALQAAKLRMEMARQIDDFDCSPSLSKKHAATSEKWIEASHKLALKAKESAQTGSKSSKSQSPDAIKVAATSGVDPDCPWLITERPSITLDDVAGMDDVKAAIRQMILLPAKHPDIAKKWGVKAGGGVLLYGPPGTGKTTFAKAIAGQLDAAFFKASAADLHGKWHGESEQNLKALITGARKFETAVILFDDVDGLLPKRTSRSSVVDNRVITEFLNQVGGFSESENTLLILATTNKPWAVDEAAFRSGRIDRKIHVGLPDQEAREAIVQMTLKNAQLEEGLDAPLIAEALEGFSGAEITGIVDTCKQYAFARDCEGIHPADITWEDFENAKSNTLPSADAKMLKRFEDYQGTATS